nr:hypothetical protein [Tanacetum cinerariifolium]
DEHLDSDDDSVQEDYTIPYDQYLATKESQDVPTEASPIPPTAAYILQTLTDLTIQVEGHRKVNQEQALVNASLSVELDQCLGFSNSWYSKKAQLAQHTLYDGHKLLQPSHAPVTVSDSHETLLETEVSRMKMSQKLGHVTPVDYTKLNALQFVDRSTKSVHTKPYQAKHVVNTSINAWNATKNTVARIVPIWKPTGRRFNLHDIFGSRTSTEPIVKPSKLTPCVSPSTNATLSLEPIFEPVELSLSVSSCASLTITMVSRFFDYRLSDRKAGFNGISSIFY